MVVDKYYKSPLFDVGGQSVGGNEQMGGNEIAIEEPHEGSVSNKIVI